MRKRHQIYEYVDFIRKVLFPEDALPHNLAIRSHYKNMIDLWLRGAIDYTGQKLYPFDVAVFYNYKDCARELVGYEDYAKMLRERKTEMSLPRCSLFYREYIVSFSDPLLLAYCGDTVTAES
ncbi:hypothetical protein OESDEN_03577 [Oesophagostomum dentatum]|uniref:Uncharacterized protein n=1 Tax=Oesophagostomum dentatum TaxID=61180 RepID=A0A0B1TKU5_OESDE|nr:hypothetical protein OESDEN_03577 [Oesophagostomum dentatum]